MLLALPTNPHGEFLTVAEVSERSGFDIGTVRRAIRSGRLRASQPNGPRGRLLVMASALDAWLQAPPEPRLIAPNPSSAKRKPKGDLIGPDFDDQSIRQFAQKRGA